MNEPTFRRLPAEEVARLLSARPEPLVLDVRREDAFRKDPRGLPGAVPIVLDRTPIRVPDVSRSRPIVVYCL